MARIENKTYRHIWSALCSHSVLDQDSNNLSLFNLIEKVTFMPPQNQLVEIEKQRDSGIIFAPFKFEIVSRIKKNIEKEVAIDIETVIVDPQKIEVGRFQKRIDLRKEIKNMRFRNKFNSFPITVNGEYEILINMKEQNEKEFSQVASIPLEIELKID